MSDKKTKVDETKTDENIHPVSGLKVRRQAAEEVKIVNKPNKMKLVKPKRKSGKIDNMANSALLVFPTDRLGITTEIKAAMIRAGSKVGTDKETLRLIDDTLRILRGHIQARYNENVNKPVLKQRVVTKVVEDQEDVESSEEASEDETEANKSPLLLPFSGNKDKSGEKGDE